MEFKKITQIIWILLATMFIVTLLLFTWSNMIVINSYSRGTRGRIYYKINKITGTTHVKHVVWSFEENEEFVFYMSKWDKPELRY